MTEDISNRTEIQAAAWFLANADNSPIFPVEPEIPDHYDWLAYARIQREVKDKATRKDNPEYEECCECGTCFTEDQEKFIYTPLTKQELKDRKAYLKKYKDENEKPRTIRWRRIVPFTGSEEKASGD